MRWGADWRSAMTVESLTTNDRVTRACQSFARRWGGLDPDNAFAEAILAVLETERDRFAPTVQLVAQVARQKLGMRCRREIRERARAVRYARWRASLERGHDPGLDVPDYLAALTPREYQAVHSRLWLGLSEAESGARMGCSPITATVHYHAAIRRLRRLYCD